LFLSILLLFQAYFTFRIFPIHHLDPDLPILVTDHAPHYYQTVRTLDLLERSHRAWGYDPHFMAGYPTALEYFLDNFGAAIATGLLSLFMPLPLASKVFLLTMVILLPCLLFWSCRNFSLPPGESFLSGLLSILVLNTFWFYMQLLDWGLYSFIFGAALTLLAFSCFYRYLYGGEKRAFLYYLLLGSYGLALHPLSALLLLIFILFSLSLDYRKLFSSRLHLLIAGSFVLVALNLYWLLPMVRDMRYYIGFESVSLQTFGWTTFVEHLVNPENGLFHFMILCSMVAPLFQRKGYKVKVALLTLWAVFLTTYLISYFAVGPVRNLFALIEPGRFIMVSALLAPILGAQLFVLLAGGRIRVVASLCCLFLLLQIGLCSDFLSRNLGDGAHRMRTIILPNLWRSGIATDVMAQGGEGLVKRILDLTDNSARILIEDSQYLPLSSHFLAVLPLLTGREFIGGPYYGLKLAHRFAAFSDGELFFKKIGEIPIERFMEYMDLYNIQWAFVHSPEAREVLRSHPKHFHPFSSYRHMEIYRVNREASYFIEGEGDIHASLDRITITNASRGDLVIKYHYLETLKADPPLGLEKHGMLDDPIGFIKIHNDQGADQITLYNGD